MLVLVFSMDYINRFDIFIGYENLIKAFEKARRVLEKDQGTFRTSPLIHLNK
jgi:hypothetical protein